MLNNVVTVDGYCIYAIEASMLFMAFRSIVHDNPVYVEAQFLPLKVQQLNRTEW